MIPENLEGFELYTKYAQNVIKTVAREIDFVFIDTGLDKYVP